MVGAALIALAAAVPSLGLPDWDPRTPFVVGEDGTQISMQLKTIHEFGWYWANADLGFPLGLNGSWFPELNVLHVAAVKVLDLALGSGYTAGGLYLVLSFPLTAASMYLLARSQGLSPVAGAVTGVLLANAPGHAGRYGHLYLAQYWVVPVALWLVLEVARGRSLWRGRVAGSVPRRAVTVTAVLVVGLSGAYYVGFTLILLAVATVARRAVGVPRDLLRGLAVTGGLAVVIAGPLAAAKLGTAGDVVTGPVAATRVPGESETYAGKLMDLLLPWPDHRLEPLSFLTRAYGSGTQATVEVSALGIVAVIGLVGLTASGLALLLAGRVPDPRVRLWSGLALVSFVFYTVGGLGSFVALFGTPQLRAWSRMSLYVLVFALLAVGLALTRVQARRGMVVALVLGGLVTCVGVLDQTNPAAAPDHRASRAELARMQTYVTALQGATAPGCGVFQLPVVPYPESGPYLGMDDYDQLRPYLADSELRWSAGAMRGTARADWMRAVDLSDVPALGRHLRAAGFCAVEVDHSGFTPDTDPSAALGESFGAPVATSSDGELDAFALPPLPSGSDASTLRASLLSPVLVSLEAYAIETDEDGIPQQDVGPVATLGVANLGPGPREVTVSLDVRGVGPAARRLVVRRGDESLATMSITERRSTRASFNLTAPAGLTSLTVTTEGEQARRTPQSSLASATVSVVAASPDPAVRVATEQAQVASGVTLP